MIRALRHALWRRVDLETVLSICLLLGSVAFALHASDLLYQGRYSVTRQDYWRIYSLDLHVSFPLNALTKHNDHPVFFPSLIWLPILHFFHNDQTILFFVGLALTFASVALLLASLWWSPSLVLVNRLSLALIYTVACLWLGKANILTSGGFSCMNSTAMVGVIAALLGLYHFARTKSDLRRRSSFIVIFLAAIVSSFSFASGLAVWPTLAIVALAHGLSRWVGASFIGGGALSAAIFVALPNDGKTQVGTGLSHLIYELPTSAVRYLEILGAPWFHYGKKWLFFRHVDESIYLGTAVMGAAGVCLAIFFVIQFWRSFRVQEPAEAVAFGLMIFILVSMAMIVIGRGALMSAEPDEVLAPRYCFWSPFFWAALPVLAFYHWPRLRAFPLVTSSVALLLAAGALPSQIRIGGDSEKARKDSEDAALQLVCGVEDQTSLQRLFMSSVFSARIIYPLAEIYRERKLDMFAWPGAQWMGQPMPKKATAQGEDQEVVGDWQIDRLVPDTPSGAPAAHFFGWCALPELGHAADCVLVSDESSRIVGLGWITNRRHARSAHPSVGFKGYIRNYSSASQYECRAVSEKKIFTRKMRRIETRL